MPESLATEAFILVAASALGVLLCARFRVPVVLGYLLAGVAVGPHGTGWVGDTPGVAFLAWLGMLILLFTIGLEFSFRNLWNARGTVLLGGGLQVVLTTALTTVGALLAGWKWDAAVVLGGAVSMSSTALVVKQLTDQGEIFTHHGSLSVGILLFQDLATLPFLILVGQRSPGFEGGSTLLAQLAWTSASFLVIALFGRSVLHALLGFVARMRSNEVMLLTAILLALGTASGLHFLGVPPLLGAFLVGMILGETDFRYQIQDDLRPFRDTLVGLFFVTVGMMIDLGAVLGQWSSLLAFTFLLVLGKGLLLGFLGVVLRWPRPVTLRTALILAHGGEFGLLLLSQAVGTGLIAADLAQPLLGGVVLSMILAPLFIARHDAVVERLVTSHRSRTEAEQASWLAQQSETLDGHVLLLGCGRVGRQVAAVLEAADVPYLALEADPNRFQVAKRQGHRVVLADAGRLRLLDAVGIARARLVIATFSYPRLIERIIHHARQLNPNVKTLVSAADEADLPQLARAGVTAVFPENLAAGLALGNQALLLLGRSHEEAARVVTELRALLNPELEGHLGV